MKNFGFRHGDICRICNTLQKCHGRKFIILGFQYNKSIDQLNKHPCGLNIKYLDTNRRGSYLNSFDSLKIVGYDFNVEKLKDQIKVESV